MKDGPNQNAIGLCFIKYQIGKPSHQKTPNPIRLRRTRVWEGTREQDDPFDLVDKIIREVLPDFSIEKDRFVKIDLGLRAETKRLHVTCA